MKLLDWLRGVLSRPSAHQRKLRRAYVRGRNCAIRTLHEADADNAVDMCRRLRNAADGEFNTAQWEAEFDRGIRDVVLETLRELGHP